MSFSFFFIILIYYNIICKRWILFTHLFYNTKSIVPWKNPITTRHDYAVATNSPDLLILLSDRHYITTLWRPDFLLFTKKVKNTQKTTVYVFLFLKNIVNVLYKLFLIIVNIHLFQNTNTCVLTYVRRILQKIFSN